LATVYGIVKQHQGWIEVESQSGAGAHFKVFLPAADPKTAAKAEQTAAPVRGGHETILLVEDEPLVGDVTRRVLEAYGYTIHRASSPRTAQELWAAHAPQIDLVLTDMIMPGGVTGRELAQRLRAVRPELKVVFMSGYGTEIVGQDADFFRQTKSGFLQKPFTSGALLRLVRECLDGNMGDVFDE
jgi:CheY-like chemotaxis protein